MLEDRYKTDRRSTARAMKYVNRFNTDVKDAGGIFRYMAGPTFHGSEQKHTEERKTKRQ